MQVFSNFNVFAGFAYNTIHTEQGLEGVLLLTDGNNFIADRLRNNKQKDLLIHT